MKLKLKWKIIFSIILLLIIIYISVRFIGNIGLVVREYKITNKKLESFYGLKIAHFSDLHYGMSVNEKKLNIIVNKINMTKPDIVVFTGDLIDKNIKITDEIFELLVSKLSKINSKYGKYYVSGNHDKNNKSYNTIMTESGFQNLNESYDVIYLNNSKMFIGGIDTNNTLNEKTIETLNLENYDYKIMLSHYPDNADYLLKYNVDLILSGHSHNGQVRLPVIGKIITPNYAKKYYDPYYKINDTLLYISGGIGNSTMNFRLFNKPSFNLYRLVNK